MNTTSPLRRFSPSCAPLAGLRPSLPATDHPAEDHSLDGFAWRGLAVGLGGVAMVLVAGCTPELATSEQSLAANQTRGDLGEYYGNFTVQDGHVKGDFGEYHGQYEVTSQDGTTRVKGDLGEYHGDFTVHNGIVQGDFGEYHGNYQATQNGNVTRVVGDTGEYHGDYTITTHGETTRIAGDFGEYYGDFSITRQPDGSQRIEGDFGESYGNYTVTPEAGGFHVKGDFGPHYGDYHIGGEMASDDALLHPPGVGSLIAPTSSHAPPRWPSAIKIDAKS
jgi:hypothetical protein